MEHPHLCRLKKRLLGLMLGTYKHMPSVVLIWCCLTWAICLTIMGSCYFQGKFNHVFCRPWLDPVEGSIHCRPLIAVSRGVARTRASVA